MIELCRIKLRSALLDMLWDLNLNGGCQFNGNSTTEQRSCTYVIFGGLNYNLENIDMLPTSWAETQERSLQSIVDKLRKRDDGYLDGHQDCHDWAFTKFEEVLDEELNAEWELTKELAEHFDQF